MTNRVRSHRFHLRPSPILLRSLQTLPWLRSRRAFALQTINFEQRINLEICKNGKDAMRTESDWTKRNRREQNESNEMEDTRLGRNEKRRKETRRKKGDKNQQVMEEKGPASKHRDATEETRHGRGSSHQQEQR